MDVRLSFLKSYILLLTWFSFRGRVGDDVAIFLVQESDLVLSTRMSNLAWSGCSVSRSLIVCRTTLNENMIMVCSRLLIVIRSKDLVLRCFSVLCSIESGNCAQC